MHRASAGNMLRLALALRRSQIPKLLLGHRLLHALRRALEVALVGIATLGGKGSARRLLLRSEEHTSELQSLMRISYAVFCLKNKQNIYSVLQTLIASHDTTSTDHTTSTNYHNILTRSS